MRFFEILSEVTVHMCKGIITAHIHAMNYILGNSFDKNITLEISYAANINRYTDYH